MLDFKSAPPETARERNTNTTFGGVSVRDLYDALKSNPGRWAKVYEDRNRSSAYKLSKISGIKIAYDFNGYEETNKSLKGANHHCDIWACYDASEDDGKVTIDDVAPKSTRGPGRPPKVKPAPEQVGGAEDDDNEDLFGDPINDPPQPDEDEDDDDELPAEFK